MGRAISPTLPEDRFDLGAVIGGDGNLVLIADVRLDNRADLYRALGRNLSELSSVSDAMVVMRCIERWGDAAIERLVGDFAIALWKRQECHLILARDFLGHRPLHFHRGDGFFAFASMPKGLHALPDVSRELDGIATADLLALMPRAGTETFFKGIERVEPGTILRVGSSATRATSFWNPRPKPLKLDGAEQYAQAIAECLTTAVDARLRCIGGVATHLSAGFDSSAVTATAARLLMDQYRGLVAFTAVPNPGFAGWVPPGRFADEGPRAAQTAAMYPNIEHVRVRSDAKSPLEALDRHAFLYERPGLNLCNDVWADAINDEARKRHCTVMLTGQMGNATISYSGHQHLADLLARLRIIALGKAIISSTNNGASFQELIAASFGPFVPKWLWAIANKAKRRSKDLAGYSAIRGSSEYLKSMRQRALARGLDLNYRPRRDSVEARLWMLRRADMGNYLKGVLGGWGIDMRDPTSDRRLVELCLSIPAENFMHQGPRALARRAFEPILPKSVLAQTGSGYQAADWFDNLSRHRDQLQAELSSIASMPAASEMIDVTRLQELVKRWPDQSPTTIEEIDHYRLALLRSIAVGHFARRIAGDNR